METDAQTGGPGSAAEHFGVEGTDDDQPVQGGNDHSDPSETAGQSDSGRSAAAGPRGDVNGDAGCTGTDPDDGDKENDADVMADSRPRQGAASSTRRGRHGVAWVPRVGRFPLDALAAERPDRPGGWAP